ncbi:MAG TPA: YidC/Oxa1 family membrane protein insertase [Anaerolineaceae bacterium]|nr:YidC/Oxa1 family membrane protein insertase [Anaerolineaceae bacterium]HPN50626.1 YidC/Oxa1 family membrane protein insertase [Anaerolineaceae bacterium]
MDIWGLFVNLLLNVLLTIYSLVGNFGIAIILFTILIRLATHPLTVSQLKSSQAMQGMQTNPRWLEMQKKYKDDKEKLAQAQMDLYKELGVNPFASCLPTLIQFPIIIGLYQSIIKAMSVSPLELLNMTRSIYTWIPFLKPTEIVPIKNAFLWMDLAQPERLIIPGLSFGIPVLVIIVVITTYLQGRLMMPATTGSSTPNDQSAQMANMMNLYMPFLMGWMAFSLASGLAVYFVTSNVVGIVQYAILGKANWRNLIPSFSKKPAVTVTQSKKPAEPAPQSKKTADITVTDTRKPAINRDQKNSEKKIISKKKKQ